MEISPQQRDITLKVLQHISENPELINDDERFKSLIAKIYKQGRKANKKKNVEKVESEKEKQCCYICQQYFTRSHDFYSGFCLSCGNLNYAKRNQTVDLSNRVALVTGARIRIGYATALKLLRFGATVIVTTRFPHDAAKRYSQEADFIEWQNRLHIYGLDLRHLASLEGFTNHVLNCYSRLDIIINNAAQTVRRPLQYYRHLLEFEALSLSALPPSIQKLVYYHHDLYHNNKFLLNNNIIASKNTKAKQQSSSKLSIKSNFSTALSKINLVANELEDSDLFPVQIYNKEGEQIDLRSFNSWSMKDEEVDLLELVEVQIINAIAPFIINSRLKKLMTRNELDTFIINVSSAEGRFNMSNKSWRHPHTNMAKAALNQMTRTCAKEYAQNSIFMNAVDPGWVSFQQPYPDVVAIKQQGIKLQLDSVDSAARICDPIYLRIAEQRKIYGKLLRNYQEISW